MSTLRRVLRAQAGAVQAIIIWIRYLLLSFLLSFKYVKCLVVIRTHFKELYWFSPLLFILKFIVPFDAWGYSRDSKNCMIPQTMLNHIWEIERLLLSIFFRVVVID